MIRITAYFIDGTVSTYVCTNIKYDARAMFARLDDGKSICIPYANVFVVVEEERKEVTE